MNSPVMSWYSLAVLIIIVVIRTITIMLQLMVLQACAKHAFCMQNNFSLHLEGCVSGPGWAMQQLTRS